MSLFTCWLLLEAIKKVFGDLMYFIAAFEGDTKDKSGIFIIFCHSVSQLQPPNIFGFKSCYFKLFKISFCMIPKTA